IRLAIESWMSGEWYQTIAQRVGLEHHQALRLINSFIIYSVQTVVSAIIRIRELETPEVPLPAEILNWPTLLQYGIDSSLKLGLVQMGLRDRVALAALVTVLESMEIVYKDSFELRDVLR